MGVLVGREGSGKSWTAMKIAESLDPSFTADRVIFDVGPLLEALRERDHAPGQAYVLDEAGVQLGRRTWQERSQVLVNQALQLIRNHNLILLFTLPRLGELDSQAQGRLQAFFEATEKEPGEYVRGKWKWLDPDRADRTGTVYHHFPRRQLNGQRIKIKTVAFTPPSEELTEPYEERKREFQDQFYKETLAELNGTEGDSDDADTSQSPKEIVDAIQSNGGAEDYISTHGGNGTKYVDADLIEMEFDVSIRDARKAKKLLEKSVDLEA